MEAPSQVIEAPSQAAKAPNQVVKASSQVIHSVKVIAANIDWLKYPILILYRRMPRVVW